MMVGPAHPHEPFEHVGLDAPLEEDHDAPWLVVGAHGPRTQPIALVSSVLAESRPAGDSAREIIRATTQVFTADLSHGVRLDVLARVNDEVRSRLVIVDESRLDLLTGHTPVSLRVAAVCDRGYIVTSTGTCGNPCDCWRRGTT